jgi:hypothetical protein
MVKLKVLPLFSSLSTQIRPPWANNQSSHLQLQVSFNFTGQKVVT